MTTVSYEVCTEEQWTELNASLRQLALKWGTEEVLDTPIGHNLKRCTQYYKFYPLNYIRAFLPKVEAWFVGMIDLHIFYIDKRGTLYLRIWLIDDACLRPVNANTFPAHLIDSLRSMIDQRM